jgi:hypothetical protein
LIKSIFNSISAADDSAGATRQVDGKGAYVFVKKIGHIEFDDNSNKVILSIDGKSSYKFKEVTLGTVMAVYRNLRENYEFRLKFDEAGKFFIKEMELKRNYRTARAKYNGDNKSKDLVKSLYKK